jgi:Lon protease-like protein
MSNGGFDGAPRRFLAARRDAERAAMLAQAPPTLGLFPLHSVLLPGAALSLRVFEPRYLDLVRECSRDSRGFGVCLILIGEKVGIPATPAQIRHAARIEDFATGSRRPAAPAHPRRVGASAYGHARARQRLAAWRTSTGATTTSMTSCARTRDARLVLQQSATGWRRSWPRRRPARFDEAAWVGWRLAELLPLHESQRQALLQLDDPQCGWTAAELDRLIAVPPRTRVHERSGCPHAQHGQ